MLDGETPQPDYCEAARFLSLLDPSAEAFTFQLIPKIKGQSAPILNGSLDMLCGELFDANERGDGVFVTVNETDLKGRKLANMRRVRAVWVDHDDPARVPDATPLIPSFVVRTSPGKFQAYWIVDGLTFEQHKAVMRRMVADYGSDKNAADLPRVLRLAGSLHTKGEPFLVRITAESGKRYTAAEILAAFPPVEAAPVERAERVGAETTVLSEECARIVEALTPVDASEYGTWLQIGMALFHHFGGGADGCQIWDDWSATAPNYDADVIDDKWNTFRAEPGQTPVTIGTLYDIARASGWRGVPWQVQAALGDGSKGMEALEAMPGEAKPLAPVAAKIEPLRTMLQFAGDIDREQIKLDQANAMIKGICQRGALGFIYGEPGAGKTFVALDMAWHIATGNYWGHPDYKRKTKAAPVLYCALEGVEGFVKRFAAIADTLGDPGTMLARCAIPKISLKVGDLPDPEPKPGVAPPVGVEGVKLIVAAVQALSAANGGQPVGMVIIDTMARAMGGANENDSGVMSNFCEWRAGEISRLTGAAVFVVHHANKGGTFRGSSAGIGAADFILKCTRDEKERDRRTLIAEKVKDDTDGPLFDFALKIVSMGRDADGDAVTSCVVEPNTGPPAIASAWLALYGESATEAPQDFKDWCDANADVLGVSATSLKSKMGKALEAQPVQHWGDKVVMFEKVGKSYTFRLSC